MAKENSLGPLKPSEESYDPELTSLSKEICDPQEKLLDDMRQPFLKCRYEVAFVVFCCFFISLNVRLNMSVGIVAMVNHSAVAQQAKVMSNSCSLLMPNSTQTVNVTVNEDGEFLWSPDIQGYVLSSFSLGYFISQIPAGRLVDIYGYKWFLFISAFVTSVATFLIPAFAWISPEALIALQLIRGLSQGITLPATSALADKWFTGSDMGKMYSFMVLGCSLGCIFSSLLSGFLCASSGKWPSSFYATGAIGFVLSILLLLCVYECPETDPRITKAELNSTLKGQEEKVTKKRANPPWCKIFTSVPVYALFYSNLGNGWAAAQFAIVHPIFLGSILHYPIAEIGMFTALAFLVQLVFITIAVVNAPLMIEKNITSITDTVKFWNFISTLGFSASMLGICLSGCNRSLSVVFAVLSAGFTGTGYAGSFLSVPSMAPAFGGIVNEFNSAIRCLPMIFLPLIVGFLTDEQQTIEQWNKVFLIGIALVMSSGIVYCIFGSAMAQPWNFVEEEKEEEKEEEMEEEKEEEVEEEKEEEVEEEKEEEMEEGKTESKTRLLIYEWHAPITSLAIPSS